MNSHLVTIEIRVECGANEWVQLDGLTFDQHWLERLDTETVQGWCTVQQNRVLAYNFRENIPHFWTLGFYHAFCGFNGGRNAVDFEFGVDERLEQLECHFLRQPALVELQLRPNHDHRTARVIHALTEQVLTEATLLTLQHVGERFQRTFVGAGDHAATAAVIEQGIDRLLQHALLVAHDDVRRAQLKQALQTVVTVDDAAVKIVEIGRRETATIQRHEWAQLWWNHRNNFHDHPLRLVARIDERFDDFQAFHQLFTAGFRGRLTEFATHRIAQLDEVEFFQQFADGFRTDHRGEGAFTELVEGFVVLVLVQDLVLAERRHPRIGDDVPFEVENLLEVLQHHVEQGTDARWQRFHEPDMRNRCCQFDMAHALTAHFRGGDFYAALLADDAAVFHALVLAAQALVILDGPEDAGAEQTVALRLEGAVVDRLRLLHFTEAPAADLVRAGDCDLDLVELLGCGHLTEHVHQFISHFEPLILDAYVCTAAVRRRMRPGFSSGALRIA